MTNGRKQASGSEFPGTGTLFARGVTRRCPRCGSGHLFHRYFSMVDDCPRCGLRFEREPGYWTGALAINIGFVFTVFIVAFACILVFTIPDVPVGPTLAVLVPVMVIGPIVFYPFSKTLWLAVDYGVLRRMERPRNPGE